MLSDSLIRAMVDLSCQWAGNHCSTRVSESMAAAIMDLRMGVRQGAPILVKRCKGRAQFRYRFFTLSFYDEVSRLGAKPTPGWYRERIQAWTYPRS